MWSWFDQYNGCKYECLSVLDIHLIAKMAVSMKMYLNTLGQISKVLLKYVFSWCFQTTQCLQSAF